MKRPRTGGGSGASRVRSGGNLRWDGARCEPVDQEPCDCWRKRYQGNAHPLSFHQGITGGLRLLAALCEGLASEGRPRGHAPFAPCRCTLDASRSWPVRRVLTVRWINRVRYRTPTHRKQYPDVLPSAEPRNLHSDSLARRAERPTSQTAEKEQEPQVSCTMAYYFLTLVRSPMPSH